MSEQEKEITQEEEALALEEAIQMEIVRTNERMDNLLQIDTVFPVNPSPITFSYSVGPALTEPSTRFTVFYPKFGDRKLLYETETKLPINNSFYFRVWPSTNAEWKKWVTRVRSYKENIMRETGILAAIDLSVHEFKQDTHLIPAALCFWNPRFNHFRFKCGPMAPTVADVCNLLGLLPVGEDPNAYMMTEKKRDYPFTKEYMAYTLYIDAYSQPEGEVNDQEYYYFLAYWLSKFIFCPPSQRIVNEYSNIAKALVAGRRLALAPHILSHVYRICYDLSDMPYLVNQGGPVWFLQMWLYAYFPELNIPVQEQIPANFGDKYIRYPPSGKSFFDLFQTFFQINEDRPLELFQPFRRYQLGTVVLIPTWLLEVVTQKAPEDTMQGVLGSFLIGRDIFHGGQINQKLYKSLGELYMPSQFARQLGFVQSIPFPMMSQSNPLVFDRSKASKDLILEVNNDYRNKVRRLLIPTGIYSAGVMPSFDKWWKSATVEPLARSKMFNTTFPAGEDFIYFEKTLPNRFCYLRLNIYSLL